MKLTKVFEDKKFKIWVDAKGQYYNEPIKPDTQKDNRRILWPVTIQELKEPQKKNSMSFIAPINGESKRISYSFKDVRKKTIKING